MAVKLTPQHLEELCALAEKAALAAGHIIAAAYANPIHFQAKEGGDSLASQVLTETDIQAQTHILAVLSPSMHAYDLAVLTEETPDDGSRHQKDYFWCIDPLDGTLPFIEKTPGFAVSIALVDAKGTAVVGVVYDPITHTLYSAIQHNGVRRNGKKWQPLRKSLHQSSELHFIHDRNFLHHPRYHDTMEHLKCILPSNIPFRVETLHTGGAVMNALWVLHHAPAVYFKYPKPKPGGGSLWDYAATSLIFSELGAHVSDMSGKPLHLNQAKSTFLNKSGVLYASDAHLAQAILKIFQA